MNISQILVSLKQQRDQISGAIAALEGHAVGNGRRGRRPGPKAGTTTGTATSFPFGKLKPKRGRRKLSPAAKRRLSVAAKRRWAAVKKAGKNSL